MSKLFSTEFNQRIARTATRLLGAYPNVFLELDANVVDKRRCQFFVGAEYEQMLRFAEQQQGH